MRSEDIQTEKKNALKDAKGFQGSDTSENIIKFEK